MWHSAPRVCVSKVGIPSRSPLDHLRRGDPLAEEVEWLTQRHEGLEWPAPTTVGRAHLPVPSDVRASRASDMGRGRLAAHVESFWRVRHSGDGQVCPSYVALARPPSHREKPHPSRMTFAQREHNSRISSMGRLAVEGPVTIAKCVSHSLRVVQLHVAERLRRNSHSPRQS